MMMSISAAPPVNPSQTAEQATQLQQNEVDKSADKIKFSFSEDKKLTGTPDNLEKQFTDAIEKSFDSLKNNILQNDKSDPVAEARNSLLAGPATLRPLDSGLSAKEVVPSSVSGVEQSILTLESVFEQAQEVAFISNITTTTGKSFNALTKG